MSAITLRSEKGSPLTNNEVDANFTNINDDKLEISNNLSDLASASTALTNLGLTATAAEINYTAGVTSAIQTQIDALQRPSIAVTVADSGSGNKFYLDGTEQQIARLIPSVTYKFDQSDSSNSGHPLLLSTTADGTHGGGSSYTVGVTAVGTPGTAGAYTEVKLEQDAPDTLYYYCVNHAGMGGEVTVRAGSVTLVDLGVTASAAELNTLTGITASTSELNTLTGITASTSELNTLTGIPATLTATELGYVDGVTSSIQTQIDSLGSSAGTTLTKTFTAGETSTMTLSDNVLVPVISVTKEVAQTGTTNNAWDVNSSSENYTRYNTAPATTLDFDTYDVSTGSFVDSFSVASQDDNPTGLAFSADGTKMFVTGRTNDKVFQYALSTAFDVSTSSYTQDFSVSSQASQPAGIAFNNDGTKMFVVDFNDDDVNEYALTTGFDISTASYTQNFSVASQETVPHDIAFNNDGTKMFICGNGGVEVNEYALTTGFDISTASFTTNFSVSAQESNPRGLAFNPDGTKMFVCGTTGQDVNEYALTTGFDISTASYTQNFSVSAQDNTPKSVKFNTDGTKMFILGDAGDDINEYTLSPSKVVLGSGSFASADVGKTIEANSGVFILTSTAGAFSQTTAPTSYAQVASGSWEMYAVAFNTTDGDLELSTHSDTYNWDAQTQLHNPTFYQGSGTESNFTRPVGIHWNTAGTYFTTIDSNGDILYTWAANGAYDGSSFSLDNSHSVSSQTGTPEGFCFLYNGGSYNIAFVVDSTTIFQYSLTVAQRVNGGTSYANKSKAGMSDVTGVLVSNDGTQVYCCADDGDIYHYTMSTANDLATASNAATGEQFHLPSYSSATWKDMQYQNSGTELWLIDGSNYIYKYSLSTAYRIETASFVARYSFTDPQTTAGFAIENNGTRFYTVGDYGRLYGYSIGAGVSIPSGYHAAHTTTSTDSTYWTDINSMTADEAAGDGNIYYCVSTDDRTTWKVAKGTDGERSIVRNNSGTWQYNSNGTYGSETWTNATTNAELAAIQEAMGTAANQMDKTQLDAIPDANHFTLANDLDLAIIFNMSSGATAPSSDGVAINYDANVLNQGAILGTDYNYDAPAQDKVRITAVNGANLKVRVI